VHGADRWRGCVGDAVNSKSYSDRVRAIVGRRTNAKRAQKRATALTREEFMRSVAAGARRTAARESKASRESNQRRTKRQRTARRKGPSRTPRYERPRQVAKAYIRDIVSLAGGGEAVRFDIPAPVVEAFTKGKLDGMRIVPARLGCIDKGRLTRGQERRIRLRLAEAT